jgi:hypothetical protein
MNTIILSKRMSRKLALLAVLFAPHCLLHAANTWYLTNTASAQYVGTGSIYGSGSATSPFWGDFDAILKNETSSGDTIALGPGTFATLGCPWSPGNAPNNNLKANQTLTGSTAGTTLELVIHTNDNNVLAATVINNGPLINGVTVQNLTIDCDPGQTNIYTVCAVCLQGNNCALSGVTALHGGGWAPTEGYVLSCGYPGTANNLVNGCTVESCRGNYIDGILFLGGGTVENSDFWLPAGVGLCINSCDAVGATYTGNYCNGGAKGFYCDTGSNVNVVVEYNTFELQTEYGLSMGVYATSPTPWAGINGLYIYNNIFAPGAVDWATGISIRNMAGGPPAYPIENVYIEDNTIEFIGNYPLTCCFAFDLVTDPFYQTNVNVFDYFYNGYIGYNKIQASTAQNPVGENVFMQTWTIVGNTDLNGNPLSATSFPANGSYSYTCFQYNPQGCQ